MKRSYILPHYAVNPAPAIPTALIAIAVSSSQINLSWAASAGPSLKDYGVYRQGSGLLGFVTTTTFNDTGLTASTGYTYYVTARNLALVESAPSNFTSATTLAPATNNIVSISPFTVVVVGGGNAGNGSRLLITRSSGTFAAKAYGSGAPQLFDTVAHQYLNGVDQNSYAGFADGTDIGHLIYGKQSKDYATTDVMKYWTSRPLRTPFDSAIYATVNGASNMKGVIGMPSWPGAYGPRNNQTLYISFWVKSKNPYQGTGGGDTATKFLRIVDNSYNFQGNNAHSSGASLWQAAAGNAGPGLTQSFWGWRSGLAGVWQRIEVWMDLVNGVISFYRNGAYTFGSYGGLGGQLEACPLGLELYSNNPRSDLTWNPSAISETYDAVNAGMCGYDDGHPLSAGNEVDIAQFYADPNIEHFELCDSPLWANRVAPSGTANSELQGPWTRDSSTQCTVTLSQGQFSTLPAKSLFYENGRNTAEQVCQFI